MDTMERNRFEFDREKSGTETDVMLDLTEFTDECWKESVFPYFEIPIMKGTRTVADGRVVYRFRLSNELAHALETGIVNAMIQLNGQTN